MALFVLSLIAVITLYYFFYVPVLYVLPFAFVIYKKSLTYLFTYVTLTFLP